MSRARDLSDYVSTGVSAAEFDQLDTTSGTPGSGNFLRGDKTWASAGLSGMTSDGTDITITDGNLILDAGNGIDFGDTTDVGGMTSELLDDYEEGTWTPTKSSGTITSLDGTPAGKYIKIGNAVTIQGQATVDGTGYLVMGGLPFTNGSLKGGCAHREDSMTGMGIGYSLLQNATTMVVRQQDTTDLVDGEVLTPTMTYIID